MNENKTTTPATTDKQPPGVMLYAGFYEAMKNLSDELVGQLVRALMEYSMFDVEPQLEGVAACAWGFIKDYADRDRKRYEEVRSKRRLAAAVRWARAKSTDSAEEGEYADTKEV